jgi:hypothetical protein
LRRDELDEIHYQHIDDQHPDTMRFVHDVEALLGKPIVVHRSPYGTVDNVCRAFRFLKSPYVAKCTEVLKKRERKRWENENEGRHTYYWGLDCTEARRAEGIIHAMQAHDHRFPLIEENMTKNDAHELAARLGLKRPAMYDMGYRNNNCIGCIKGGIGYWQMIRRDFPEVYAARAKLERDLGRFILKDKNGNPLWLDELPEGIGRESTAIEDMECGIMCEIAFQANQKGTPKCDNGLCKKESEAE